jgi:tuberculosinol/isotuberculosinol synthase
MDLRIAHMSVPQLSEWLRWPTERVARWIAADSQPVVMGWPFNGTRRWYLAHQRQNLDARDYLTTLTRRQAELHRMIFAHGVDTILTPLFGSELLGRGSAYTQYVLGGLAQLADDEVYQEMFAAGVRIRFYGDYEEMLDAPIFRPTLEVCADLAAATASGNGPVLLIGLFADSPYSTLARLSVEFAQRWGRPPDRRELIEAYYGLAVPDLSLYLGFAQPVLFDVPLLATGQEDLYVTLNPSPSLTEEQLREILYDHLVTRRVPEVDYDKLPDEAQEALAEYYKHCSGITMGIGRIDPLTGVWKPLPSAPMEGRQGDPGIAS